MVLIRRSPHPIGRHIHCVLKSVLIDSPQRMGFGKARNNPTKVWFSTPPLQAPLCLEQARRRGGCFDIPREALGLGERASMSRSDAHVVIFGAGHAGGNGRRPASSILV